MIYLLYGTKEYNIKKEIEKFKKEFNEINISYYDLNNDSLIKVLDDSNTISLFDDKKLIICENANIFTRGHNNEVDILEKYLNNPNPNTTLIFIVGSKTIDGVKKITKLIKKIGTVKEFNDNISTYDFVKDNLKNYNINPSDINLIINRVGNNPLILENEINKIKIYKDKENKITEEDILNITTKNIETDIFKMINYIINGKKDKALEIYHEMIKLNEEPIKILILLANQFRSMYQVKELLKKGLSEKDIAEVLKMNPYAVKQILKNSRTYQSKTLLRCLFELAEIDINIKTGKVNKDLALELFILKK